MSKLLLKSDVYVIDTPKWNLTITRVGENEFVLSGNTEALKGEHTINLDVGQSVSIPLKGQKMIREPALKLRHDRCWLNTVEMDHVTQDEFVEREERISKGDWWV